jgi:PAS domain-containing protein
VVTIASNPLIIRSAMLFVIAVCTFLVALVFIRRLRSSMLDEADLDSISTSSRQSVPVHLYHTVIQELKQQKHELQAQHLAEQHRARTIENFSQTVLSNLPSGVLVFAHNGLLKQSNPAAKEILGFHTLQGMSPEDVFRGAAVCAPEASGSFSDGMKNVAALVSEAVRAHLQQGGERSQIETEYATPAGDKLHLALTISPVPAGDGDLPSVACLISDRSEVERMRTSLTTIAGYAQRLAHSREPGQAQQLAADIASEAASLERHTSGFLAEKSTAAGAASRAR